MQPLSDATHAQWSSRLVFILATTGAAVGLGNIWKFPYIAGENGGGVFVLTYLACIALLGIPIMIAESTLGKLGRKDPMHALRQLAKRTQSHPGWQWVGGLSILAGFLILSYYSIIAGWAMDYLFYAATTGFNGMDSQAVDAHFEWLTHSPLRMIGWHSVIIAFTSIILAFGVKKGIERATYFLFPTMLVFLLILVFYAIQSGYFSQGLAFLFEPKFEAMSSQGLLIALGHAFFTLSLAMGTVMMYGAYIPENVNVPQSITIIAAGDTLIAILAGMAIFPIVFANGLEPGAGPGLIFKTLPLAFAHMPGGYLLSVVFFVMLCVAAFTSTISLLEPTVAWLSEHFNWSRQHAAVLAGIAVWLTGLPSALSFNAWQGITFLGLNFFELIDYLTANLMLPLLGALIAWFTACRVPKPWLQAHLQFAPWLFNLWVFCLRWITPGAIIMIVLHSTGLLSFI